MSNRKDYHKRKMTDNNDVVQVNPENRLKKSVETKETRWDRISKKHINSVQQATTDDVQKLFGMEFINDSQLRCMNGDPIKRLQINPMILMDLRHDVVSPSR